MLFKVSIFWKINNYCLSLLIVIAGKGIVLGIKRLTKEEQLNIYNKLKKEQLDFDKKMSNRVSQDVKINTNLWLKHFSRIYTQVFAAFRLSAPYFRSLYWTSDEKSFLFGNHWERRGVAEVDEMGVEYKQLDSVSLELLREPLLTALFNSAAASIFQIL